MGATIRKCFSDMGSFNHERVSNIIQQVYDNRLKRPSAYCYFGSASGAGPWSKRAICGVDKDCSVRLVHSSGTRIAGVRRPLAYLSAVRLLYMTKHMKPRLKRGECSG